MFSAETTFRELLRSGSASPRQAAVTHRCSHVARPWAQCWRRRKRARAGEQFDHLLAPALALWSRHNLPVQESALQHATSTSAAVTDDTLMDHRVAVLEQALNLTYDDLSRRLNTLSTSL